MTTYLITLEINNDESGVHPEEWFWTDVCPDPGDLAELKSIEKIGD